MTTRSKEEVLDDIRWQASYFDRCRQIQQGINSKDIVKMSRLICEAVDAKATEEEIKSQFGSEIQDMADFNFDLAKRTRHLVMR